VIDVVEITDPGCIWSWGSVEKIAKLRALPGLRWRRVLGVPGPRPGGPEEQHANWLEVSEITGARVAERLEYVSSSSLPESLAVRAAERQDRGDAVLQRLREATFLEGRPADSVPRICEALAEVVDVDRLVHDMRLPAVTGSVLADKAEARRPPLDLIASGVARPDHGDVRYPFPTLIIDGRVLAGWTAYEDYIEALAVTA
jgi:protein-disulfide isomerase-like protein with CxxC motif